MGVIASLGTRIPRLLAPVPLGCPGVVLGIIKSIDPAALAVVAVSLMFNVTVPRGSVTLTTERMADSVLEAGVPGLLPRVTVLLPEPPTNATGVPEIVARTLKVSFRGLPSMATPMVCATVLVNAKAAPVPGPLKLPLL
jgi:hypothetical protein